MLELKNVYAGYNDVPVIRDVSLTVKEGEIVSLLGANGAGKSTLLKVVNAMIPSERGEVYFRGQCLTGWRTEKIAEHGLIQVPQGRRLFTRLPVIDNLLIGNTPARAKPQRKQLLERVLSMFPILASRRTQLAGTLSGGEQQMVAIGRALMSDPLLLILDEPSIGLSPAVTSEVMAKLVELNGSGLAIFLVEQNVAHAMSISSRSYILENGAISLEGDSATLKADDRVRSAYLGM